MPFGRATITTTVSGGGGGKGRLFVLLAIAAAAVSLVVAIATEIAIALTVLGVLMLAGVVIPGAYVLCRDVTWPWEARRINAFSAEVDRALDARREELGWTPPLYVEAERVHELEPAAQIIDLDALNVDRTALEA